MTVDDADDGDAETSIETHITAAEQTEAVRPDGRGLQEIVGDKGYHSNQSPVGLEAVGVRSYISEPDRGRRNWNDGTDVVPSSDSVRTESPRSPARWRIARKKSYVHIGKYLTRFQSDRDSCPNAC